MSRAFTMPKPKRVLRAVTLTVGKSSDRGPKPQNRGEVYNLLSVWTLLPHSTRKMRWKWAADFAKSRRVLGLAPPELQAGFAAGYSDENHVGAGGLNDHLPPA
jgi:hypothetical protein